MIRRCENPKTFGFARYGGRGIRVCERWRNSFTAFLADMGERPSASHSLDRINTNGNYEPENCRWATRLQQNRNSRNNTLIEWNGETLCIAEWAERTGISKFVLSMRLLRGWSIERTLTFPVSRSRQKVGDTRKYTPKKWLKH